MFLVSFLGPWPANSILQMSGVGSREALPSCTIQHLNVVDTRFMQRTVHARKSIPDDMVLCELERVPLKLFWQKIILKYGPEFTHVPGNRLAKWRLLMQLHSRRFSDTKCWSRGQHNTVLMGSQSLS